MTFALTPHLDGTSDPTQTPFGGLDLSIPEHPDLPEIRHSLTESVLFGGKRLRPMVCFLAGRFFGIDARAMHPFARASELTHAATLCHDDVVDMAVVRRGRPTLNRLVGNARSVLAGDILLSRVVREVVDEGHHGVLAHLAQVLEDLSAGEWLQLNYRRRTDPTRKVLERISDLKTGALLGWCLATPARLASRTEDEINKVRRIGRLVGLGFQMIDDTLDFEPDGEKAYAKDLREGMINFVALEILESRPELATDMKEIWSKPTGSLAKAASLPWGLETTEVACAKVRARVQTIVAEALELLEGIDGDAQARLELNELLGALVERRH